MARPATSSPGPEPRLRGDARRSQILDLAEAIVEAEGVDALTMRRLADAAEMKAPSLYKHWPDKEAILATLQDRALASMGAALHDALAEGVHAAAGEPADLAALGSAYRTWALDHPGLYELTARRPLARDELSPGREAWAAEPVVAAVGGDEHRSRALWAAAHGLVDLELADRFPPGADLDAAWAALVEAFTPR